MNLQTLLDRTNLSIPFEDLVKKIESVNPRLGKIYSADPINEGYEDANIILSTTNDKYVLKIFSKGRSTRNIQDYVKIILELEKLRVPTLQLIQMADGYLGNDGETYYFISKYFDGQDFQKQAPKPSDVTTLTSHLALLNTLEFPVEESYDSWGNKNLLKEYNKNRQLLTADQNKLIYPIIDEFSTLALSDFSKSVIHGDMQRKHVLKNSRNEYCILDFGCMSYDAKVFDLSTYIAWFCLGKETINSRVEMTNKVISKYIEIHDLGAKELESVSILVDASYAAYFIKTSILLNQGDDNRETIEWNELSKLLLENR